LLFNLFCESMLEPSRSSQVRPRLRRNAIKVQMS